MKRNILFLISLFVIVLCLSPDLPAQNTNQQEKDSLWNKIHSAEGKEKIDFCAQLASLYIPQLRSNENVIDTIFSLYDLIDVEAKKMNNIVTQGLYRVNRLNALVNKRANDEVIIQAPAILDFLREHQLWRSYYQAYSLLAFTYMRKGETGQALNTAKTFYAEAEEQNNAGGMGTALHSMSRIYTAERRYDEAEECLRESIELLKDSTYYLHLLPTVYCNLGSNLIAQRRYDEALEVAGQTKEINRRYEEASKSPQPSAWMNLYDLYKDAYMQLGDYDKTEFYIHKMDSISKGGLNFSREWAHILYGRGQYEEALKMVEKAIEISPKNMQNKSIKLMILIEMGKGKEGYDLFRSLVVELDSIKNQEFGLKIDELRTQYEVDRHIIEKVRNRNYFLFALSGCVLLIILLVGVFYYNRIITRKNRDLYKQIKEQDRLDLELDQLRQSYEKLIESSAPAEKLEKIEDLLPGNKSQRDLLARLREYLLRDKNLYNADINRDELTAALNVNKNTLSEAVKIVTGKTLMEYIRFMQMEEARKLIDNHPELTIEGIAFDSGFNSPATFYRLFKKQYGISPAEYRKIADKID